MTVEDLRRSLEESCDSLKLCGINGKYFIDPEINFLEDDSILSCYDFFEWMVEELIDVIQFIFLRVAEIDGQKKSVSVDREETRTLCRTGNRG